MRGILAVVVLVIAFVLILAETGIGALRGLKKSLWRVGILFVIGVALFFLVHGLAETLILLVVNELVQGEECTSLAEAAKGIVDMTGQGANVTVVVPLVETLLALAATIVIPLVFVAAF